MSRLSVQEGDMRDIAQFLAQETAEIEEIIMKDHQDALKQVTDAVQAVEDEDANLIAQYSHALMMDKVWQTNVEEEQDLYIKLEEIESRKDGLAKTRDDAL